MYYELLRPGETVTGDRYRQQLIKLNQALKRKRPECGNRTHKVIFLHDNARPHVIKPVKTYLANIKFDVLPHAPYSPDLSPVDHRYYCSLAKGTKEKDSAKNMPPGKGEK